MKNNGRSMGLAAKLSLWSTLPVILVMTIMGVVTLVLLESKIDGLVEQNAEGTLTLMENLLDTKIDGGVENYLRGIAEENRKLLDYFYGQYEEGILSEREAFEKAAELFIDPDYGRIGTTGYLAGVSSEGILSIHPRSPGADASGFEFMQKAMEMKNGYLEYEWKNVDEEEARKKAGYLSYFEPWDIMVWASSYKSEFYSLIDLQELDATVASFPVGEGGYVLLTGEGKGIVAGIDRFAVKGELFERREDPESSFELKAKAGTLRIDREVFSDTGWQLVVVTPLEPYENILWVFRLIIVLTVIGSAVFVHLFIRYFMTRNLKPMATMRETVDMVSKGDLTGRIRHRSDDEIGAISELFNRIIEQFGALLRDMQSAISILSESVHNLSTSSQEIASTSNEQAAAVKEVLSTMEDADKLSKGVELKIGEVAKIAGNTKENVEKGFTLIQTSLGKMEEIRTTNADTIAGIKTLGERIDSIWEIVNIINGIADQTKIIAFNAELEASAAGEAGKNFQIVAGEIRRLADSTVDSTNEIKTKINEIQHASDKLIIASEEGTQRIKEGWDVSSNIRGVFEDVLSSSEISATSAEEISRSIKMQVNSFEQIFLTLKQISESIDSFVDSTTYTTEVSEQLKEISDSFKNQVEAYVVDRPEEEAGVTQAEAGPVEEGD
jgi:methyl-accepting chemotaxis protein